MEEPMKLWRGWLMMDIRIGITGLRVRWHRLVARIPKTSVGANIDRQTRMSLIGLFKE